jgi:thymidine phosphorylase
VVELHADGPDRLAGALAALRGAVEVGPEPPARRPLVVDRIG